MQPKGVQREYMRLHRRINLSPAETAERVRLLHQTNLPGAALVPALAMHCVMGILVREFARYRGCTLLPLGQQEPIGRRAGLVDDIHILDAAGRLVEGYKVLHNIPVTGGMLQDLSEKLKGAMAYRYYLLTTYRREDYSEFNPYIDRIAEVLGCQLTVDSFDQTLRYYLRSVKDTAMFVDEYASRLETAPAVSLQLKQAWNEILDR